MTEMTEYVVMSGDRPVAVADTLDAAQKEAARQAALRPGTESRWDRHHTGWRLMSRTGGRGRFAWTMFWVVAVPRASASDEGDEQ